MEQTPRVPLTKFSPAVQKALLQRGVGTDGFVYPSDMVEPLTCMQDNTISTKLFSARLRPRLATLGSPVNAEVLTKACDALAKKRGREASKKVYIGATAIFAGVAAITSMAALLWLVVALRKQAHNVHGVLVDRGTGLPLRTANTDFTVDGAGLLVNRETKRSLGTATQWQPMDLSSDMEPTAFTGVQTLLVHGISAKVHGYAVLPERKTVLFFTSHGRVVLDGKKLHPATGAYAAYATLDTDTVIAEADPGTGMDAAGVCVLCTVCAC
jgi:hypothetical protein